MSLPKCHFNKSNLTARIGNIYKGYETLYEQIEDDLGAITSLFLMRVNKDPS